MKNCILALLLYVTSFAHADVLKQIYNCEVDGNPWALVQLDTGEFFVVNKRSGHITNAAPYVFETLGSIDDWQIGDHVTYGRLSNARGGFGWNSGGTYPVLNNHNTRDYVVLKHKYGRGWDADHFLEDSVREVYGNEVITEGQMRLILPNAETRWNACEEKRWQVGDPLVIFSFNSDLATTSTMIQPHAIINPARDDFETEFEATRAFFPFRSTHTYTVSQIKRKNDKTIITLSDGSIWQRDEYPKNLKAGDVIVLRQHDHYRWRGATHHFSNFLKFSAIRVDTGEEIDLFDLGNKKNRPQGQSCERTRHNREFLIGGNTLITVPDDATYQKVLSWGKNAKVTIAMANHGEGYILVNLTSYQRTFWPSYPSQDHWVDIYTICFSSDNT